MRKEIIMLAASRKHKNLCIAGIDRITGEWIRIVSEDSTISYAVNIDDVIDKKDRRVPEIFDIVSIGCSERSLNYYQSENYVYKQGSSWKILGKARLQDVLNICPIENPHYLFYNTDNKVHKDDILALDNNDPKNSLILIKPTNIVVHVQQWEKKRVKMSFTYNGVRYRYLTITDIEYEQRFLSMDVNDYTVKNGVLIVVSLGECYNDNHSKLVATVIE